MPSGPGHTVLYEMTAQAKYINANEGLWGGRGRMAPGAAAWLPGHSSSWPPGGGPGGEWQAPNLGQASKEPSGQPGGRLGEGQQVRREHVSRALSIASAPDRQWAGKRMEQARGGCGHVSTQHPPGSEGAARGRRQRVPGLASWQPLAGSPPACPLNLPCHHRTGSLHPSPTSQVPSPALTRCP